MEIKSSVLNHPSLEELKTSILIASQDDHKEEWRVKLIEYINTVSSNEDDEFFYDRLEFTRFTIPDNETTAYTDEYAMIYLNAPGVMGESKKEWDFIYCHECLHQLWDTFGVAEKIKKSNVEYNHYLLNIASDCVINDWLYVSRKKARPEGLVTPEYIKENFGIDYNRKEDTQLTLYLKLLPKAKELEKDQNLQQQCGDQQGGGQQSGDQQGGGQQGSGQQGSGQQGGDQQGSGQQGGDQQDGKQGGGQQSGDQQGGGQQGSGQQSDSGGSSPAQDAQNSANNAKGAADQAKNAADQAQKDGDKDANSKAQAAKDAKDAADKAQAAADKAKDAQKKGNQKDAKDAAAEAKKYEQEAKDAAEKAGVKQEKSNQNGDENGNGAGSGSGNHTEYKYKKSKKEVGEESLRNLDKWKDVISGAIGEFNKKCNSSAKMDKEGLKIGAKNAAKGWNQELNSVIKTYVRQRVSQVRRNYQKTYSRVKRGSGIIHYGDPIRPGKRVKRQLFIINPAFYVDCSASMGYSIDHVWDAVYTICDALKITYNHDKYVDGLEYKTYAWDTNFKEIKFGNRCNATGGTMPFEELLHGIEYRTKDNLINVILTDAEFPRVNEKDVEDFIDKLQGLIIFVTNEDNNVIKKFGEKYKDKFVYILADKDYTIH